MTFWFWAGKTRRDFRDFSVSGPAKQGVTSVTFGSRRLNPGEVRPQSRGGHASIPTVTEARFPGPKPKSHGSHGAFSRPETQKSRKSRRVSPARNPKVTEVTARFPGPKPKGHGSHGPFSQVTALPPGPETQKSRLHSRPRRPKSHKSRPVFPAPKPKSQQVTARFPGSSHGPFSWRQPPRSHGPYSPARTSQKSQVTARFPGSRPPKVTPPPSLQPPSPTPKVTALPFPLPRSAETQKFAGEARSTLGYGKKASSTPDSYDLLGRSACSEEDADENLGREKGLGFPEGEGEAHNTLGYRETKPRRLRAPCLPTYTLKSVIPAPKRTDRMASNW